MWKEQILGRNANAERRKRKKRKRMKRPISVH
jgi:hypothetical protein